MWGTKFRWLPVQTVYWKQKATCLSAPYHILLVCTLKLAITRHMPSSTHVISCQALGVAQILTHILVLVPRYVRDHRFFVFRWTSYVSHLNKGHQRSLCLFTIHDFFMMIKAETSIKLTLWKSQFTEEERSQDLNSSVRCRVTWLNMIPWMLCMLR